MIQDAQIKAEMFLKLLRKNRNLFIPQKGGNSKQREQSFSNQLVRKIWLSFAIIDLIYFYSLYLIRKVLFLGKKLFFQ